jgi:hypothetical protein
MKFNFAAMPKWSRCRQCCHSSKYSLWVGVCSKGNYEMQRQI